MIQRAKSILSAVLPKNPIARGTGVLVGGTAGAQLITVVAAPLLTRLYSPEDFGLAAVYASLLALIGVVSSLRYELAIPLPEDDVEAANVAALSLLLVAVITGLAGVLVALLATPISDVLGSPELAGYLWLVPVGVLFGGAYRVFSYWSVRTKRFGIIASTRIRQSLAALAIQLAAFKLGSFALLLGQVAGLGIGTGPLARPALAIPAFQQVSWLGIRQVAFRYRRFPVFLTWDGLLNTAGAQLPQLIFTPFFGPAVVGLYSLANKVLALPSSLIGNAVAQVFLSHSPNAYRVNQHGQLVAELQAKLISIGMPPAMVVVLMGPDIFALIFGEHWRQAGEFARWMAPWLFFNLIYSPISTLFAVMEHQSQVLIVQVILLVSRSIAIALGIWFGDFLMAVSIFSLASAICYLGFIVWIGFLAGNSLSSLIHQLLITVFVTILITSPIIGAIVFFESTASIQFLALTITALFLAVRYWQLLKRSYD